MTRVFWQLCVCVCVCERDRKLVCLLVYFFAQCSLSQLERCFLIGPELLSVLSAASVWLCSASVWLQCICTASVWLQCICTASVWLQGVCTVLLRCCLTKPIYREQGSLLWTDSSDLVPITVYSLLRVAHSVYSLLRVAHSSLLYTAYWG